MSTLDDTADIVMTILRTRIASDATLYRDTPLFEGGLALDSIQFLEIFLEIEQATGKRLRDEDLTEDNVVTVESLIQYVSSLQPR